MNDYTTYVALDVHKKEHTYAILYPNSQEPEVGTVKNQPRELKRFIRQIHKKKPGSLVMPHSIRCCYEAGCCGFVLQRQLQALGVDCQVIAPSLIPVQPGQRVKTDRRDAKKLVYLFKSGLLTEVHPPDAQQEAGRNLTRLREAAREDLSRIRHQVSKFLLRLGFIYRDGNHWTQKHRRWLGSLEMETYLDRIVLAEYLSELDRRQERLATLDHHLQQLSQQEPYRRPVGWLRCFCGIDTLTAMVLVTELYNFERFETARELMSYPGLTPTEHSSGAQVKRGGISKTGNRRVRRILIEAAWNLRRKPHINKALSQRRRGQEGWVIAIADQCHKRLYKRYWHLIARGKSPHKAVAVLARELAGFIWSVLNTNLSVLPLEEGAA